MKIRFYALEKIAWEDWPTYCINFTLVERERREGLFFQKDHIIYDRKVYIAFKIRDLEELMQIEICNMHLPIVNGKIAISVKKFPFIKLWEPAFDRDYEG